MLEVARTIEELAVSFAAELKTCGVAAEYADGVARALVSEYATFQIPQAPSGALSLIIGQYAIRKDDIKLFETLTDGLKAAAGVEFFAGHRPVLAANVAISVALAKLVRSLMQRGANLDRDTIHILTILHCNAAVPGDEGLSPSEVLNIVQRTKPDRDLVWLQKKLDYLKDVPTRDGGTTKLVSQNGLGKWRSHV